MDPSFWDKAFPTAVGAAIGGITAIAAIATKEWLDRRRNIQAWYEEVFISECVSKLIVWLSSVEDILRTLRSGDIVPSELFEPYPREAVERFRAFFPDVHAIVWVEIMRENCAKTRANNEANDQGVRLALSIAGALKGSLMALEKELLGLSISRKRQVYQIRENKRIIPLLAALERETERCRERMKDTAVEQNF